MTLKKNSKLRKITTLMKGCSRSSQKIYSQQEENQIECQALKYSLKKVRIIPYENTLQKILTHQNSNSNFPVGNNKFKALDNITNPQRLQLEEDYKKVTAKVTQVKVKGKTLV